MQLALVEAVHEQLQGGLQGLRATGETTRSSSKPGQVMAQLSIPAFNRVGVGFALRNFIDAPVIPQAFVGSKGVTVVALGLGSLIHHLLDHLLGSFPDDFAAQKAAGEAVYDGDDEDLLFLSPMKVNNSSISASLTWLGSGGSGNWSAWA